MTEKECHNRGRYWKKTALQEMRLGRGLTLTQAARELGITVGYLNTLELGRSDPSLRIALRVAEFYGKTVTELWVEPAEK